MKLNTYLNYGGNCEQALRFYEQHLGGTITMLMRRSEPPDQGATCPGCENSVQYAVMQLAETELMAADVPPEVLIPAFMISELKTAFTISFMDYIPFLVLDMFVASILTSMGMITLPPVLI